MTLDVDAPLNPSIHPLNYPKDVYQEILMTINETKMDKKYVLQSCFQNILKKYYFKNVDYINYSLQY